MGCEMQSLSPEYFAHNPLYLKHFHDFRSHLIFIDAKPDPVLRVRFAMRPTYM